MDYKTTKNNRIYSGHDLDGMSVAKNYYNWILSAFSKYIKGSVVEVGAGVGTFSEYILKKTPKKLIMIEPSKDMFMIAKKKFKNQNNLSNFNGFLNEYIQKTKSKADTIIYINVLEHIKYDTKEMKIAKNLLNKDGTICIYVPALEALMSEADKNVGHYRRYSIKSLKLVLENAGLKVIDIYYTDSLGIIPWYIYYTLLKTQTVDEKSTKLYDTLIVPILKVIESIIRPFIGKNLVAIAKKDDEI